MRANDNKAAHIVPVRVMAVIFWMFWLLDLLIMLVCLYETFMVSSNSSLLGPALLMAALLLASLWLRPTRPRTALALAGLPAGLLVLYVFSLVFRSDWR
jgi:hypothetical protein